jgi:hypothetical protein
MHVTRIQNCLEAHPKQLRIKDCFQKTEFILFLSFRVQDSHLEASESLPVQLFHFAAFPHPALSGHLQASLVPSEHLQHAEHSIKTHFILFWVLGIQQT